MDDEEENRCVKEYVGLYDFPLSAFQKYAIQAIVGGDHILVCAPTGNGKSLPAEFAIQYFCKIRCQPSQPTQPTQSTQPQLIDERPKRRRVIYTSPIKALSNQKFYDFTQKFPDLKIGILTGDIKVNIDADVLIMTAEILQNTLLKKKMMITNDTDGKSMSSCLLHFDMDFETELACIVHDEVHSINMPDRGHVWESIFMLTPPSVQHVMLSATLHSPEKLASWVENIHRGNKTVYLSCVKDRIVPLQHYAFVTAVQGLYKQIKNKTLENEIKAIVDRPILIQNEKKQFLEENYFKAKKVVDLLETNRVYIKRPYVLNKVCEYMVEQNMLPCACFILSRRQIEVAAREVTTNLLEFDSKIPYIVRNECDKYLRAKLPNAHEYLTLPEYDSMMALLEKGIATHHAGTLPILKELVELMFSKGYVKLLFCSETFSMGLNMPIKTVIFTDVMKYDGSGFRMLHGHEYNQASGRAGRRGLDTVGHVIHLTNLFKKVERVEYRNMMRGDPQQLTSKFKVDAAFVLHRVEQGCRTVTDMLAFAERSMIQLEIDSDISGWDKKIVEKKGEYEQAKKRLEFLKTPANVLERWLAIQEEMRMASNKRKKELERERAAMVDEFSQVEKDCVFLIKVKECELDVADFSRFREGARHYLEEKILDIVGMLGKTGFLDLTGGNTLTSLGIVAANLHELPFVFASTVLSDAWSTLSAAEMIRVLCCFTAIRVNEEMRSMKIPGHLSLCEKQVLESFCEIKDAYANDLDLFNEVDDDSNSFHYDLLEYIGGWCEAEEVGGCKYVLQRLEDEKQVFLGDFVKAVIKIGNCGLELEKVAELFGRLDLLEKYRLFPGLLLKYVAVNQSLYV